MEPLQPSSKTKKAAAKRGPSTSKRAENAELLQRASDHRHPRAGEDLPTKLADLERQMKEAAARLDFEEAARLRDIIRDMQ